MDDRERKPEHRLRERQKTDVEGRKRKECRVRDRRKRK